MAADTLIIGIFVFLTTFMLVGGLMAYTAEKIYLARNPDFADKLFHNPRWSKEDLTLIPRHVDCPECNSEIIRIESNNARRNEARRS